MAELTNLRARIDEVDQELVQALVKRYDLVLQVARAKQASGRAVFDPEREKQVLAKVNRLAGRPEYGRALEAVYQEIMDQAKELERDFLA
ncbi:chorismate mutase [Lactobacillus nasalidis]|uniref:Chorismate mutase n=1 Tax=Lactobacillus nasalidis TaxID=2797258 RepID=A0ABQ3W6L7_9LACO|nr:chorismate mutase [Lactobacillus nasalidis]GHV98227.1 chorismate mutase [Lactobacillus nasalidis]GHW00220.1 chorismate mutase [Lactobacillus nasalidis]GHW00542.1 chorismate mutase [Lactobacillus nasalidis]